MKKSNSRTIGDRIRVLGVYPQVFLKGAVLISLITSLAPLAIE